MLDVAVMPRFLLVCCTLNWATLTSSGAHVAAILDRNGYTWLFCADVKHVQVRTFFGACAKMLLAVETAPDLQTGLLPKYHALVPLSCAHRARIVRAFKAPQGLY